MTRRLLPPDDWADVLVGTDLEHAIDALDPARTCVLVVEDSQGAVVGCWAFVWILHAEGVWIAPSHRGKGSVFKHLIAGMRDAGQAANVATIWTCAQDEQIDQLATHLGAQLIPARSYAIPTVKGES